MNSMLQYNTMIREVKNVKLGWLFEQRDETYLRFNYEQRESSKLIYRIPEHQRFPSWKLTKKQLLIDSVIKNYPIHDIMCIKHYEIDGPKVSEYYDIEDGQTRLSVLQEFYSGGFKMEDGRSFEELPHNEQRKFENYEICFHITTLEDDDDPNCVHDMFERYQMGEPLKDHDKFWNRKDTPIVKFAVELIKSGVMDKYMGTKNFSSQNRKKLSDITSLICLIVLWSKDREYINNTYLSHYKSLDYELTDNDKTKVRQFINYYFEIIDLSYTKYDKQKNEKCIYSRLGVYLGHILYDYFENNTIDNSSKVDMWATFIEYTRRYKTLIQKDKQLWNNVEGNPTWSQPKYIGKRCERIIEFCNHIQANTLEGFCEIHGIEMFID